MTSTLQITISGRESSQRLQKTLDEGNTVRVGRAVKSGWEVPWDLKISREHFDLNWEKGRLLVHCLEQARNPIQYCGQPVRDASIAPNEWFQIGDTTFHASSVLTRRRPVLDNHSGPVEFLAEENREGSERAYSAEELRQSGSSNLERQMEFLELLPDRISASHSDGELAGMLSQMLLDAIPNALAVAVAHFDETSLPDNLDETGLNAFPKPLSMRVQTRDDYQGRFNPSRRMFFKCLKTQSSVLHIFVESGGGASFTMSDGLGWAFCAPIKAESGRGWCLYISGKGAPHGGLIVTENDLIGDLRFTQLVAHFIGSIRQVRMLQEQKTQLSSFFSPKVIEGLTNRDSKDLLSPAERDITVLFCDVRGFSKKAEALQGDLLTLLKSVSAALSVMASGIVERDGAIADFQGDAALGFWGWPTELEDGAAPACRSAMAILRAFTQSVTQNDNLLFGFSIGMGIAHGRALAGQIGTNQQSKVGVFGPVVNQGSRLEGLTKQFGVPICIDEQTAEFARRFLPPTEGRLRRLARVRPKGMDTPITVFELLPPLEFSDVNEEIIAAHEAAVDAVIRGDWRAAAESLRSIPDGDGPKQFLIQHMAEFGNEPPADWDGAFSLGSK
jgi:adenylate cyclase